MARARMAERYGRAGAMTNKHRVPQRGTSAPTIGRPLRVRIEDRATPAIHGITATVIDVADLNTEAGWVCNYRVRLDARPAGWPGDTCWVGAAQIVPLQWQD